MTNGNPFYVHPGADFGPGLMGLAQTIGKFGDIKKEENRIATMKQGALDAYKSKDPEKIRQFMIQNPEMAASINQALSLKLPDDSASAYKNALFSVAVDPLTASRSLEEMRTQYAKDGIDAQEQDTLDKLEAMINQKTPKEIQAETESALALLADENTWKRYKDITEKPETKAFTLSPGQTRYTGSGEFIVEAPEGVPTPNSDIAKLGEDLANKLISNEDYLAKKERILNPTATSKAELTARALNGDMEARNILDAMGKSDIEMAMAKGEAAAIGKIAGLQEAMDLEGTARAILEGRETIENVRNTFGVPIQETVRSLVLKQEPDFNFVQPRAIVKSLNSSLMQQQKNRGAMGSFVANINRQVDEVEKRSRDIIKRVGIRALDVPWRELNVRFIGSGHERVFEAYMKEISAEINKLSQGSTASVALLPEQGRIEWEKIHDVNLSMKKLMIVLRGTRDMANIRLKSVQDEIDSTIDRLSNVRNKRGTETLYSEGDTATNKTTGEQMIFRNGQWENL